MAESTRNGLLIATRTLGALALLVIGCIHFQQYEYDFYSAVPTIGTLFLLNFIGGVGLGLFLLVPFKPRRLRGLLDQLAALAGIGLALGGIVALLVSEQTTLFGFMEHGYRFVIVLTLASEAAAVVLLVAFLVCARLRTHATGTQTSVKRSATSAGGGPMTVAD